MIFRFEQHGLDDLEINNKNDVDKILCFIRKENHLTIPKHLNDIGLFYVSDIRQNSRLIR